MTYGIHYIRSARLSWRWSHAIIRQAIGWRRPAFHFYSGVT